MRSNPDGLEPLSAGTSPRSAAPPRPGLGLWDAPACFNGAERDGLRPAGCPLLLEPSHVFVPGLPVYGLTFPRVLQLFEKFPSGADR